MRLATLLAVTLALSACNNSDHTDESSPQSGDVSKEPVQRGLVVPSLDANGVLRIPARWPRMTRSGCENCCYLFDGPGDQQRAAADDPDFGLAVLVRPQPGDILGDHQIIAAARREQNELHERAS